MRPAAFKKKKRTLKMYGIIWLELNEIPFVIMLLNVSLFSECILNVNGMLFCR